MPTAALARLAYCHYAIGGYNINNLEQILGLFKDCIDPQAPFILQISKGARTYADKEESSGRSYPKFARPCKGEELEDGSV